MFTAYLKWWDRHPWMVLVILGVAIGVLIWQGRKDASAIRRLDKQIVESESKHEEFKRKMRESAR